MSKPPPIPVNFNDKLHALIGRIQTEGWEGLGVDVKALESDLKAQRTEKARDSELQQSYKGFHRAFAQAQADRYARYMKALDVLRAAHRDNPEVLASLETFKRTSRPRRSKASKAAKAAAPAPTPSPTPTP